jgi:hypothetical protein
MGEQQPVKQIELVKAEVLELDPTKRYLVLLDGAAVSPDDGHLLKEALADMGVNYAFAMMVDGDPATSVQIVEL